MRTKLRMFLLPPILLEGRWREIDLGTWALRFNQGDVTVLSERLIGYFLNQRDWVNRETIFGPIDSGHFDYFEYWMARYLWMRKDPEH